MSSIASRRSFPGLRGLLTTVVLVILLTGCAPPFGHGGSEISQSPDEVETPTMDNLKQVEEAIIASDERVVAVDKLKFNNTLWGDRTVGTIITVNSPDPLTEQTLKAILDAIWYTSEPRPIDIDVIAIVVETGDEVDIRPAATALVGEAGWLSHGRMGVSLLSGSMKSLYGIPD